MGWRFEVRLDFFEHFLCFAIFYALGISIRYTKADPVENSISGKSKKELRMKAPGMGATFGSSFRLMFLFPSKAQASKVAMVCPLA